MTVKRLFEDKEKDLELKLLSTDAALDRPISAPDINRVGMALAGYTGVFIEQRVQIFGETEISYLGTLTKAQRKAALARVFSYIPMMSRPGSRKP